MNMFEYATKNKVRFTLVEGSAGLSVEDLWDLKLTSGRVSLNGLAKAINKKLKEDTEESFVVKQTATNTLTKLKFDIVKYIIDIRLAEQEASKKAVETKAYKEKLMGILASKKDEALEGKSVEELEALLSSVG